MFFFLDRVQNQSYLVLQVYKKILISGWCEVTLNKVLHYDTKMYILQRNICIPVKFVSHSATSYKLPWVKRSTISIS